MSEDVPRGKPSPSTAIERALTSIRRLGVRRAGSWLGRKPGPLEDYLGLSVFKGRDPYALFDRDWYLAKYPDVAEVGVDPLWHYLTSGGREGRDPHPLFDTYWYLDQNPEVRDQDANPLVHYLQSGAGRGRDPHPAFDGHWYLSRYPDVAREGWNPLLHYLSVGAAAGFDPNPMFNTQWYRSERPDIGDGVNPLVHYLHIGAKDGVDPSPEFDSALYLARLPVVAEAGLNPLVHYLSHGRRDGIVLYRESYRSWVWQFDRLTDEDRAVFARAVEELAGTPLISVLMSVGRHASERLARAIDSVRGQFYPHWELTVAIDASAEPELTRTLEARRDADRRIRLVRSATQDDAAGRWNAALEAATGAYVTPLDCGDELSPHALFWLASEIVACPTADVIYSDEDKIDADGRRHSPHFKPDWGAALFASQDMFGRLAAYRRELAARVGGFRSGVAGYEDWDLGLRCADASSAERIRHIPRLLCHRRSVAAEPGAGAALAPSDWATAARVVEDHLRRRGLAGKVVPALERYCQVVPAVGAPLPKVSIIIPSTGRPDLLGRCIDTLLRQTTYPDFEVLVAVNESAFADQATAAYLKSLALRDKLRVLAYENQPYNFSRVNNWAVQRATGGVLCFMNDDVEVIMPDWLEKMVARLRLERVGAVGPMMYFPNGTIQHAGIILGLWGVAGHCFINMPHGSAGYFGRAALEQDLSGVTAACMVMRRDLFDELKGFNEDLAIAFNDVDLCIRIRNAGWRIIWTPSVEIFHHQSATLGDPQAPARRARFEQETRLMRDLWGETLDRDPFYNPNLSLTSSDFALAIPPRVSKLPAPQSDRGS